jgi:hypothetical protein
MAVALLVLLLIGLSLQAIATDAERFDLALQEMDSFWTLEAALHRDVLSARASVLPNYDPLVRETAALDVSVGRLWQVTATDIAVKDSDRRRTSEEASKLGHGIHIRSFGCLRQIADRHVLDHGTTQRAHLGHRGSPCQVLG